MKIKNIKWLMIGVLSFIMGFFISGYFDLQDKLETCNRVCLEFKTVSK